jgi:hypothetical protein
MSPATIPPSQVYALLRLNAIGAHQQKKGFGVNAKALPTIGRCVEPFVGCRMSCEDLQYSKDP